MNKNFFFIIFFLIIFLGICFYLFYNLDTNIFLFIIFSSVFNLYLLVCLYKKNSFIHLFFSIFLWLGFYFKYLCVEIIYNGIYPEINDTIIFLPSEKNKALIISSLACIALILSYLLHNKFIIKKDLNFELKKKVNFFLEKNFFTISTLLFVLVGFVTFLNLKFAIYQKGIVSYENNLYFLNLPIKISLIYGFSSLICLVIFFYNFSKKKIFFYYLFILENFFSSISSLSRGMIFNSFSLIITNFYSREKYLGIKINYKKIFSIIFITICLFLLSLLIVDKYRNFYNFKFLDTITKKQVHISEKSNLDSKLSDFVALVTKRFVGIDSVVLLSSKNDLGIDILYQSLFENYNFKENTFFEKQILGENDLTGSLKGNVRTIKTPGLIAFIYYSGNYFVLFFSLFLIGIILSQVEKLILNFSFNNIYLCSLLSQVIVYRLIHFGINPIKSLLFFVPIIIILIFANLITKLIKK